MSMPDLCPLCPPTRPILAESDCWSLVLNENQATLGRLYCALKRHETDVTALTPEETLSLWKMAGQAKRALDSLFAPDHYNYLFHMNLTPHVHMHIYPRYRAPRAFAGQTWTDVRFGDHYDPSETRLVNDTADRALQDTLRAALRTPGGRK